MTVLETRHLRATAVFDLEDAFARRRGVLGAHPRVQGPVRVLAVARIDAGGARVPLEPPLELELTRNDSGFHVFFGIVRLSSRLRRRIEDGTYAIRIETGGRYQLAERADVTLPEPAQPYVFALEPGYAYPFPPGGRILRGALHAAGGDGVPGARVEVVGVAGPYATDDSGQWALAFTSDPGPAVAVRFTFASGAVIDVPGVAPDGTLNQASLEGFVITQAGGPIAGAAVVVTGQPGAATTRADGSWSFFLPPGQPPAAVGADVTATLRDGRSQTVPNVGIQPRATVVVPTFRFV